jgi:hypothetical protein
MTRSSTADSRGDDRFPLREAVDVDNKLKAGHITGRAVLIPDAV